MRRQHPTVVDYRHIVLLACGHWIQPEFVDPGTRTWLCPFGDLTQPAAGTEEAGTLAVIESWDYTEEAGAAVDIQPLIACGGREVDDLGRHTGDPCTNTYQPHNHDPATEQARAAGWGIHRLPDGSITAICPRCRRPDPDTVAACRDLQATVHKGASA